MKGLKLFRFGILCGTMVRAGLERVVCDLALGAHGKGLRTTIFSFYDGPLAFELLHAGVDVEIL